jgi:hypothetical protein
VAVKRYNGVSWDTYAGSDLAPVQSTDGRAGKTTWVGATAPTSPTDGDIWIDQDTATNAVVPTVFSLKGQLLAGTGSSAYSANPVGTDGYTLMADSNQTTGLTWNSNYYAGKNWLINGAMEIDQRNTATTAVTVNSALKFTVDRWFLYNPTATNITGQRVSGANVGMPYALQINGASGFTGGNVGQRVESSHIAPIAGQTVTFSMKIYSTVAISNASLYLITCNVLDNTYGGPGLSTAINLNVGLNTVKTTFVVPASMNIGGEFGLFTGSIGAGGYIQISAAQVEIGSTATTFSRAGGTLQGELAACQRYYRRWTTVGTYGVFGLGTAVNSTRIDTVFSLSPMRIAPTSIDYNSYVVFTPDQSNIVTQSALTLASGTGSGNTTPDSAYVIATVSGATQFRPYIMLANANASAYIGFSAELA